MAIIARGPLGAPCDHGGRDPSPPHLRRRARVGGRRGARRCRPPRARVRAWRGPRRPADAAATSRSAGTSSRRDGRLLLAAVAWLPLVASRDAAASGPPACRWRGPRPSSAGCPRSRSRSVRDRALRHDAVLPAHGPAPAAHAGRGAADRPRCAGHAAAARGLAGGATAAAAAGAALVRGRGARPPGRRLADVQRSCSGSATSRRCSTPRSRTAASTTPSTRSTSWRRCCSGGRSIGRGPGPPAAWLPGAGAVPAAAAARELVPGHGDHCSPTAPLYPHYATLGTPYGITALADQQTRRRDHVARGRHRVHRRDPRHRAAPGCATRSATRRPRSGEPMPQRAALATRADELARARAAAEAPPPRAGAPRGTRGSAPDRRCRR